MTQFHVWLKWHLVSYPNGLYDNWSIHVRAEAESSVAEDGQVSAGLGGLHRALHQQLGLLHTAHLPAHVPQEHPPLRHEERQYYSPEPFFFWRGFYRAMLCIRGTSHGPVSVRPSVRLSVTSREFY